MTSITTPLVTASGVNDIFIAEDRYAVVATPSGVDIVDLLIAQTISSGTLGGEPLCVAVEDATSSGLLYIGTATSGIYAATWKSLRGPGLNFTDRLVQIFTTSTTPPVSSNQINDLAVQPDRVFVSTASGVDFITFNSLRASRLMVSGSSSCQMTPAGETYWTVINSGVEANYDLFPASGTGIINVDFEYNNSSSSPLLPTNIVTDLAVVPGSPNLLGFATSETDLVIEEAQGFENTSLIKTLYSGIEPVISVDFSKQANFTSGTEYVATSGALRVFNLGDNTVIGTHFVTIAGDDFESENTRGQPLVTGTVTVVRTTGVA